ncbi:MAG: hypothetical protein HKN82_01680 [Akkermansiaceae bacterium]|nr:hypothetical protein [Akkermansiaceae bacterium]
MKMNSGDLLISLRARLALANRLVRAAQRRDAGCDAGCDAGELGARVEQQLQEALNTARAMSRAGCSPAARSPITESGHAPVA